MNVFEPQEPWDSDGFNCFLLLALGSVAAQSGWLLRCMKVGVQNKVCLVMLSVVGLEVGVLVGSSVGCLMSTTIPQLNRVWPLASGGAKLVVLILVVLVLIPESENLQFGVGAERNGELKRAELLEKASQKLSIYCYTIWPGYYSLTSLCLPLELGVSLGQAWRSHTYVRVWVVATQPSLTGIIASP